MNPSALLVAALSAVLLASAAAQETETTVGVVGLGQMGQAIVQCYDSHKVQVHAWNRGEERRQQVQALNLENAQVHETLEDVLESADLIIMAIAAGDGLQNAETLIKSVPASLWKGKTLMQFSAHEPTSAKTHEAFVRSLGADLIAGAMLAVPEDVCGDGGLFLVASTDASVLQQATPVLEMMGPLSPFTDDVGLASLADIGVLQSTYFGVTGFEMTYKSMERYGAPPWFGERLRELCAKTAPEWLNYCVKMSHHVMSTKQWTESVDNAEMVIDVFHSHYQFFRKMGIADDIYLKSYLKYAGKIPDKSHAVSRWIEYATKPVATEF